MDGGGGYYPYPQSEPQPEPEPTPIVPPVVAPEKPEPEKPGVNAPKEKRARRLRGLLSREEQGYMTEAPVYKRSLLAAD